MNLTKHEAEDIIERLQTGNAIPDDYMYKLFPIKQKEYELIYGGKMRKEDILANEDGVFPVPLQIEKIFNGKREQWKDGWKNIIAFGDNLQFLKTIYENKDPLIKNKIKGKVKLIYIDPPFATEGDFQGKEGQKAYTDKSKGSEFIEFLRRRLIVARELLSDDGSIYVHMDIKKGHYMKVLLDEIFGENSFRNEICWYYPNKIPDARKRLFTISSDFIYFYSKTDKNIFNPQYDQRDQPKKRAQETKIDGKKQSVRDEEGNVIYDFYDKRLVDNVWNIPSLAGTSKEKQDLEYPTQKPEKLLQRIIQASTNEGDIVFDFFAGSGTLASVAEKLGRKWITCDIGKLAFYTIQKRLLNIESSKSLIVQDGKYAQKAKSFLTINTGYYDLQKIFDLQNQDYSDFVMNLFEVVPKLKTISGIHIDGERKDGYNVIVWRYWKTKDSLVDEDYLHDLHSHIGSKTGKRVYIIAPASYVDFISDYYEIDKVRYYFLKVPYHIIRELHKVQFKKFRQPQKKSNVNDLEDAIGFHFMRQPEVKSELKVKNSEYLITIKSFLSHFSEEDTEREMGNFESLAMVLIDKNFDGETFDMDSYYFAEDLLSFNKKSKIDKDDQDLKNKLRHVNQITLPPIPIKTCGKNLMVIYVDIYGNEFKEEFKFK